jgi:hypothetical protein
MFAYGWHRREWRGWRPGLSGPDRKFDVRKWMKRELKKGGSSAAFDEWKNFVMQGMDFLA